MTVRVTAEADTRQGAGFAVIRVEGLDTAPDGVRFMIRRPGYREDSLGPTGWQAAEAMLEPDAAYVAHGVLVLHVGPSVVSQLEPGMNVGFTLVLPNGANYPGRLAWPAIAGPIGGAGARRGRMVATQRSSAEPAPQRTGSALVGDTPPPPPPVPNTPAAAQAAVTSEPLTPPPPPPLPQASVREEKPEPASAAVETDDAAEKAATEADADAHADAEPAARRADLHAERDPRPVAELRRRGPWKRRVAVAASIAVLMIAGAAAASVYFGAEEICGDDTVGPFVDDWGFCPPVQVAAEEETGGGWNIDPLAWLGPQASEPDTEDAVDRGVNTEPPPSPESQRALARQFLATNPTPEEAFARAQELLEEGQVEAAFLIFRYAAERGLADAATQVAAMYDPETYTPESSPLPRPNPAVARIWYERAVAAGDPEALLSLARLLASQEDVEGARAILHQAEEAGLVDAAAQLLEELQ